MTVATCMPPKKAAFEPKTVSSTVGRLCIEDRTGNKVDKGEVEVRIFNTAPLEYFLQVFRGDDLLIAQEINSDLDFDFRVKVSTGESRMAWLLMREDGSVRLLELRYTENAADFKFAISIALFETSFQQEFAKVITDDDQDWVADGIAGATMSDEQYIPDYELQSPHVVYTMNDDESSEPTREQRIKALQRSKKEESEPEDDDDEDTGRNAIRSGPKTPSKKPQGVKDGALLNSTRKGKTTNSLLESGMSLNRTYVARGARLGVFAHNDDEEELTYMNTLSKIQDDDGNIVVPDTIQLHDADRKMLMLDKDDHTKIFNMDLETGVIIDTWQGHDSTVFNSIAPRSKYAQTTNEQTIIGTSDNALFTIDPRMNTHNKIAKEVEYKTKVGLTTIAANGAGHIATGSKTGDIRLYSQVQKGYCKTLLPGLGHEITHVDLTEDGSWMVATTNTYLLLIPLIIESTGKTGFEARMGKEKPTPMKLTLTSQDRLKYNIEHLQFTKARFNTGTMANIYERWIATSTGDLIITFDFDKIKKGQRDSYKITATNDTIVRDVFRHNHQNEVVVAQADEIWAANLNADK